ncbi:MAG: hypothetical protein R2813_11110, partial [Flavobacteriales bacterium]
SSDGYVDQFGGADGKKFLITRFRKLLYSLHCLSTQEQHEFLVSTLAMWKRDNNQTDDILILGIRI